MVAAAALLCVGSDSASADNMLQNSSAESGSLPDADFWVQEFGSADVINDPALARTGSRVWALLSADPGNGISSVGQLPVVEVGERFTISGWVRIPNASPTHQPRVRIRWGFFAPGGGVFSSVSGGTDFALKDSNWTLVTSPEITCPAEGAQLVARIYVYNTYQETDGGPQLPDTLGLNFPAYVDDLTAESPDYSFATVSGTVTDGGLGVAGALVKATQTSNPSAFIVSAPSGVSGNYSLSCRVGKEFQLSASSLPPGRVVATAPAPFTPVDTTPLSGKDLTLAADPTYDEDLLFAAFSSDYSGSASWVPKYPPGASLNRINTPGTLTINDQPWVANRRTNPGGEDGFELAGIPGLAGGVVADGASVVVAIRPIFPANAGGERRGEIVSLYYNGLTLCADHETGEIMISRKAWDWVRTGYFPANGAIVVLSLVVQSDGSCKLYSDGVEVWTGGAIGTDSFKLLQGTDPNWMTRVGVGRNPWDGWSSYNGDIGDVYVYKKAISDSKRIALESSLITKFGDAVTYTVTASAGTGGAISPVGAITVPQNADQSFTITPAYGFLLDDVVVDGESEGPVTSYTFPDVTANHTIEASFIALPTISGAVTDSVTTDPIYSAVVSISQNADGSAPIETTTTNSAGEYQLAPPDEFGTYHLIARKGGHVTSSVLTVTMTGVSAPGRDFALVKSATLDPLVSLDSTALSLGLLTNWTNGGSLGGTFDSFAADRAPEVVADLAGRKAVVFTQNADAENRETLVSTVPTPRAIAGASDWTISTVIYRNPGDPGSENCYMSWSGRDIGGWPLAQYRTAQFCYRDNLAAVHYGADFGFDAGTPAAGEWHNVTITYNGSEERLYVDGVYRQSRFWTLNLKSNTMMMVGSAYWDGNNTSTPFQNRQEDQYWRFNGAIASLQIYDQALTDEEVASLSVDPNDTDGDGMLDSWEIASFGNLGQAAAADFDNDGTDNLTEFRLGLTANSGSSRFALTGGAGSSIQWPSVTGVTFKIERSTTLTGWNVLEASYPGTAVTTSYTDPAPPAGRAFYRVTLNN